ncbi:MAG: hypothetical protein JSS89_03020 [Bacteroidetes bacterium]|nr:hypothetical protein [Bacteroidota bacterium]
MQSTAAIVAILISSALQWLWNGLVHGFLLAKMEQEAFSVYSVVMHPAGQEPNMGLWFIPTVIGSWYLLHVLTRKPGPFSIKDAVIAGIILTLVIDAIFNMSMYMYFANYPLQMAGIGMGVDVITGAIAGGSLGFVYNKMAKA